MKMRMMTMTDDRDGSCEWAEDIWGAWLTDCGNTFEVNEGLPSENSMIYCCFCGQPILETPYRDEDIDEDV
jgi:hypothetical protein